MKTKRQTETGETTEETSGCVRLEQLNKWRNSMIARWWWLWRRRWRYNFQDFPRWKFQKEFV